MTAEKRRTARIVTIAALAATAAACISSAPVNNTGYTGTWSRGNDRVQSIVAIVKQPDGYRFRWTKVSSDGKLQVRCGWDGACEERLDGKVIANYRFTPSVDASGKLRIEAVEERLEPEKKTLHYVDQLEVEPGGKVLWSYTIERDGQKYEGNARPKRSFRKVSDGVAEPPGGTERS